MSELLRCPFCGATGEEVARCYDTGNRPQSGTDWFVRCYVCHVETARTDTQAEAIAAWNRRALPLHGEPITGEAFVLGETWPDWFAVLHMHNIAITGNIDGRWGGGPDFCEIRRPDGSTVVKKSGHTITPRDFFAPAPPESPLGGSSHRLEEPQKPTKGETR